MGAFLGSIQVEQIEDYWRLLVPLVYVTDTGKTYEVPAGQIVDFASIPSLLWPLMAPTDPRWSDAAVLHDGLYASQEVPRRTADAVLYDASFRARRTQRWALWLGVRAGGMWAYKTGPSRQRALREHFREMGWG